jgi:transposase
LSQYAKERIVYVDEAGVDTFLHREFGRALRGQKVYGEISGKRYSRESFIAGLCNGRVVAPICFDGACDALLFNWWLEYCLIPELKPNQVVVVDNASFHKSEQSKVLVEKAKCRLLFLPPYSPDLNPIEKLWANLKAKIKSIAKTFQTLKESIDYAFQMVSHAI